MSGRLPEQSLMIWMVVLWLLVIALALVAGGDNVVLGDPLVARWVQKADGSAPSAVADFGNWVGKYWSGVALCVPIAIVFAWRRRWRPVILLIAVHAIRALNTSLKWLIDSPRPAPDLVRVTENADGLGFPSGHAMGSTLVFGALAVLAWRNLPPGRTRATAVLASVATVLVVGFGRIQTGAHWPTDVLGGYLLGASVLVSLVLALDLHRPPAGRRTLSFNEGTMS